MSRHNKDLWLSRTEIELYLQPDLLFFGNAYAIKSGTKYMRVDPRNVNTNEKGQLFLEGQPSSTLYCYNDLPTEPEMPKFIVPELYRRFTEDELVTEDGVVGVVLKTATNRRLLGAMPVEESVTPEGSPETEAMKEQVSTMMTKIAEEGWHYNLSGSSSIRKTDEGEIEDTGHRTLTFSVTTLNDVKNEDLALLFPEEAFWDEGRLVLQGSNPLAKECWILTLSAENRFTPLGQIASVRLDGGELEIQLIPPEEDVIGYPDKVGGPLIALTSSPLIGISRRDKNGQTVVFQPSSATHINGFFINEESQVPRVVIRRRVFEAQLGEIDDEGKFTPGFTVPSAEAK